MLSIKVDPRGLQDLAKGLGNVSIAFAGASVAAVNTVAEQAKFTTIKQIPEEIRLTEAYVASKMSFKAATEAQPTAIVSAEDRPTVLTRFQVAQLTKPASSRAKGDPSRGIPPGRKAAGVHVTVKAGADMPGGFLVPLKGGNGLGVFTRIRGTTAKNAIKHRYGPSVDQAFNTILKTLAPDVADSLEKQAGIELDEAIKKALA